MNSQIIIDFPILATALLMYFGMKGIYKLLCYFCPEQDAPWRSGYIAGHNALAEQLRSKIDQLVGSWEKVRAHEEKTNNTNFGSTPCSDDRKVPGKE